jgi:serine/threonine-protein kinase HipA
MPRKRQYTPLRVLMNNRTIGHFSKEAGGAVDFLYDESWLDWESAIPVSLSLPLREDAYRGAPVLAVFENLLPDSDALRRQVAGKVGAEGTDAYSLLAKIGRDCVGAMQFLPEDAKMETGDTTRIDGIPVNDQEIEGMLKNLAQAPLGLGRDEDFRISVAGAQEKTSLLWHEDRWLKPRGTTPTTHLLKTQMGTLPNGLDLSLSVENEYYCLKLAEAFGLPVNAAEIQTFGRTKALVVERFDRRWTRDGRLLRLPQEDCRQALSVPPSKKYQTDGGPGMVDILRFLKGSDNPPEDQKQFLKAQMIFWLIGATDGHAKNFSLFLRPEGRFSLTPLYDILTAQPSLASRQIEKKQVKMAMSVGDNRHYVLDRITGRHFRQTAKKGGVPDALVEEAIQEICERVEPALRAIEATLPIGFSEPIHLAVSQSARERLEFLT